jgi:hypothetical protein
MCNLYSITTNQAAIIALFRVVNRYVGNLPPMPGVFPDYPAPVVRNAGTERELTMMRWGITLRSLLPAGQEAARVSRFHRLWSRHAPSNGRALLFECVGIVSDIFFPKTLHHSMHFVRPMIVTIL